MACRGSDGQVYAAAEMMFGLNERFHYFECGLCGCLQLLDPPSDLARFYPQEYYSFSQGEPLPDASRRRSQRERLSSWRNESQLMRTGSFGRIAARIRPRPDIERLRPLFAPTPIRSFNARILDVGCGDGTLLADLWRVGFRELVGIDPFLAKDLSDTPSLRILAAHLAALRDERFDLIMFHHSLEHMSDHRGILALVAEMLRPNGICLIRMPVASSEPWSRYREHWVELDAPRHRALHTTASLDLMLKDVGLERFYTEFDSTGFAYWGSELYLRGVSLVDPGGKRIRDPNSLFCTSELEGFERQAKRANEIACGGRAAFYIREAR